MQPLTNQKIVLAGREFLPVGRSTVAQDVEFTRLLRAAGLEDPTMRAGETPEAYGWRILQALIEAGSMLPLLACLLVPAELAPERAHGWKAFVEDLVGVDRRRHARGWTLEVQAETVEFLAALDEPADKSRVYELVAELLFPFLKAGLGSWAASLRSSGTGESPVGGGESSVPSADATSPPGVG